MRLKPFFSYYGSKFRIIPKYPRPQHPLIVEAFAGSAAYACMWSQRKVILVEKNPVVAGVWDYLIRAKEAEILALPIDINHIDELHGAPQEAKWLVGFWFNSACVAPASRRSAWQVWVAAQENSHRWSVWNEKIRTRIASQQSHIRHWKIINKDAFSVMTSKDATWFVDPPYVGPKGAHYPESSIDYTKLGEWCLTRKGQVIVCENVGATWLPFRPFVATSGACGKRPSQEAIYTRTT